MINMPIPFLLIGAVAAAAGGLTVCGKINNEDLKKDVNGIYDEIKKNVDKTNADYKKSYQNVLKTVEKLDITKSLIRQNSLEGFKTTFIKIKNIELKDMVQSEGYLKAFELSTSEIYDYYKKPVSFGAKLMDSAKMTITYAFFGSVGTLAGTVRETYRLEDEVTIARARKKEAKVDCEKVKLQISINNEIKMRCQEIQSLLLQLQRYLDRITFRIEEIIENTGTNYLDYNEVQRQTLRMGVNIAAGINEIITKSVTDKDGKFNTNLINDMKKVKNLQIEDNDYQNEKLSNTNTMKSHAEMYTLLANAITEEKDRSELIGRFIDILKQHINDM